MDKSKLKQLFSGLCCSVCKHDFDENAIFIKRQEKDLLVLKIICPKCGKSFGVALLGTSGFEIKEGESPFEIQETPLPINYDDVIEAHKFIDKLEKDWTKYIPDELKNPKK